MNQTFYGICIKDKINVEEIKKRGISLQQVQKVPAPAASEKKLLVKLADESVQCL